jgi:Uma2 family endonuclease
MGEPKRRGATYQDVLDAPEHVVAEILNGELVLSPRPAPPHAFTHTALTGWLHPRFGRGGTPGGWLILLEPELHLEEEVVVPDLGGWRLARAPALDDEAYFTLPPDWVCEVLSKSTEKNDRTEKLAIYAEHGVGHVWLIHPIRRTLEVLRRQDRHWLSIGIHKDDQVVRVEPFDAVELDLATLWGDVRPRPTGTRASEAVAAYDDEL